MSSPRRRPSRRRLRRWTSMTCSPRSSSASHLSRPPSPAPPPSASAGASSSPTPASSADSASTTAATLPSSVGGSIYWMFSCTSAAFNNIIEFDFQKQSLAVIQVPPVNVFEDPRRFMIIRADSGGLGFLYVTNCAAQLWKWKMDYDGVASWVLERSIELDKLLSLNSEVQDDIMIAGYAEENNAVFLWALSAVYEVQLQTLQFKLFRTDIDIFDHYHPFGSVYTEETDTGNEHHGAELLHNA